MSGEDFLLKWNDHHSLFFAGAEELCESEEYTDVTLSAGSKFFPAHKLVLSICSPYFRSLFRRLGSTMKPVIFLKDVQPKHLELLLQYMYKGEIKVEESELVTVLNTAQGLEIKGLTDSNTDNNGGHQEINNKPSPVYRPPVPAPKRPPPSPQPSPPPQSSQFLPKKPKISPAPDSLYKIPSNVQVSTPVEVKQEVAGPVTIDLDDQAVDQYDDPTGGGGEVVDHMDYGGDTTVATGYEEAYGEEYYQDESGMVPGQDDRDERTCLECGKECSTKYNLHVHLRTHSGSRPFQCMLCDKSFSQSSSMYRHMRTAHNRPGQLCD